MPHTTRNTLFITSTNQKQANLYASIDPGRKRNSIHKQSTTVEKPLIDTKTSPIQDEFLRIKQKKQASMT